MTMPEEMFNAIRNARMFMVALADPKVTPKIPKEVRKNARDRLKHFPSEFDLKELENIYYAAGKNPNIVFNDCMKRLESVRGELILAEGKVANIGQAIINTITNTNKQE